MLKDTLKKFGYPDTLIKEYSHWIVLLRQSQVTLGSLILISKEEVTQFPQLSQRAFSELRQVSGDIETALKSAFQYDKINYLMLMMVDREVHYHVIPRYTTPTVFGKATFTDQGWPGAPDLKSYVAPNTDLLVALRDHIKKAFPA